jgi:hypothetical protein
MTLSPRFTRSDLIREADLIRPGVTGRLITDWIELGLLDHPHKRGKGRGAGSSPGTWSSNQKDLFLSVWRKRPGTPVAVLCNIPVYLWVFWGDEHVPLRQVRRAMATWVGRQRVYLDAADGAAAQLLSDFGRGPSQRATRGLLAEALRVRPPDLEQMREQLVAALGQPVVVQAAGARPIEVSAASLVGILEARLAAMDQLQALDDPVFEWARFTNVVAASAYGQEQPALAGDPLHGRIFVHLEHNVLVAQACRNLLTTLGMALTGPAGPAGTLADPHVWRDRNLRGVIRKTQLTSAGMAVEFQVRSI